MLSLMIVIEMTVPIKNIDFLILTWLFIRYYENKFQLKLHVEIETFLSIDLKLCPFTSNLFYYMFRLSVEDEPEFLGEEFL